VIIYRPKGVCSEEFRFTLNNGTIENIQVIGGCNGNLKGICALLTGTDAAEAVNRLKGIRCGEKSTSCPDQLAQALEVALKKNLA